MVKIAITQTSQRVLLMSDPPPFDSLDVNGREQASSQRNENMRCPTLFH